MKHSQVVHTPNIMKVIFEWPNLTAADLQAATEHAVQVFKSDPWSNSSHVGYEYMQIELNHTGCGDSVITVKFSK